MPMAWVSNVGFDLPRQQGVNFADTFVNAGSGGHLRLEGDLTGFLEGEGVDSHHLEPVLKPAGKLFRRWGDVGGKLIRADRGLGDHLEEMILEDALGSQRHRCGVCSGRADRCRRTAGLRPANGLERGAVLNIDDGCCRQVGARHGNPGDLHGVRRRSAPGRRERTTPEQRLKKSQAPTVCLINLF